MHSASRATEGMGSTSVLARPPKGASTLQAAEQLKVGALWRLLWTQSAAMWFIQLYILLEYVRPQTIYPWIDVAPWSQIALIGATLFVLVEGRVAFAANRLWFAVILFSLIIVASFLTAYDVGSSWQAKDIWLNWLLLMLIVGGGIKDRRELILLLLAFGLWNLKMTQHGVRGWISIGFAFRAIGIGGAPGWFQNSGEFGIQMCIFLPLVAYFTYGLWPRLGKKARYFLVAVAGSALFSIVASSSRGALVGAAGVGVWAIWRNPQRVKALFLIAVTGVAIWAMVPEESKSRFREMGDDKSSTTRLTYWKHGIEIANKHPVLGIGYKNWMPYYTTHYNPRGQLPHNFAIEAVSELGYVGLLALVWIFVEYFRATAGVRRRTNQSSADPDRLLWSLALGMDGAMIGFIISGSFVSVLYYPYIWMNVAMVLALVRVERRRKAPVARLGKSNPTRHRVLLAHPA